MNAKEIQDLISFIANSGLDEVNLETTDFKIKVKRHSAPTVVTAAPLLSPAPVVQPVPVASAAPVATEAKPQGQPQSDTGKNYLTVKSPMIGTFYRSASPDKPPFVSVGDEVRPDQVLCIIEAMKLFNEIQSEVSGRIVKVLVENATPVEFDQPLFLVEPA
ncbi:MAG: acetyl-CoA carboxylase biotin carboxyl carrier protein [Bernardetiaceae bacterium]|jgi:acetyl-CoA carboxylase biotin carboxyl carrier protein|nr:acetyl-CoA carboxylase biotin carboxyl carrier protein [Bernardetiaceae bacterium]